MTEPDIALAEALFHQLAAHTRTGRGIVRDSYGAGEAYAHDLVRQSARDLGLDVQVDCAGNTYALLAGRDRSAPMLLMGSHLDSVPQGGNYDGAAGVLAGLAVLSGLRKSGIVPPFDIGVIGIRAEESAWFNSSYVGTHAAFGRLPPAELDGIRRSDTGRTLAEHMAESGCDVDAVRRGVAHLSPARVRAFIELHIEQGPILDAADIPVGLVTGIRGCVRYRSARCRGAYAHSGAEPRRSRRDAVAATVALVHRLNGTWFDRETAGEDLTFTVGEMFTDARFHGPSKVAGETQFVLDIRSISDETMSGMAHNAAIIAAEIAESYRVEFDLGAASYSAPALADSGLLERHEALAGSLGISAVTLASGAGHDAAMFACFGVPMAMIFVRNANGSHNPDEAMRLDDFALGTRLLTASALAAIEAS